MLAFLHLTGSNVIAVTALVFTVVSFWLLNARPGHLRSTRPRAYAFGGSGESLRLRFPLVLFNTGAVARLVGDLRLVIESEPEERMLRWATTRNQLRPGSDDDHAFPTPFAVHGRDSRELIAEFQPARPSIGRPVQAFGTSSDSRRWSTSAAETSGSTSPRSTGGHRPRRHAASTSPTETSCR